jgi:hypothetical protein
MSTLLYGSEVWPLRYSDLIENITFYKRLLRLSKSTPNPVVPLQTRLSHISLALLKPALNSYSKISRMSDYRYPKLCLIKLIDIHNKHPKKSKHNWFSHLHSLLSAIVQDHDILYKAITKIIELY